jgi:hypothetical protein
MTEADRPSIVLGLVVAPGLPEEVASAIERELAADLNRAYTSVGWRTELETDRLVSPPAPTTEIFDAARRRLLQRDWDLGVVITDLPLRRGRRPVTQHVSPTHGVAVVSLPALGAIKLGARLRRTMLDLVGELVGDVDRRATDWDRGVLRELATDTVEQPGRAFVLSVLGGNLRLLAGMLRANRPWRLAIRLYAALAAAIAASVYGVVTGEIWQLSSSMGWWRLTLTCAFAISLTVAALIVVHGLWERAPDRRVRDQVVLFNVATLLTVVIGVLCLYAALLVLILAGAALVITPDALGRSLGHAVGIADYAELSWFVGSIAIVAGALGAALESDEAVREAAYAAPISEPEAGDSVEAEATGNAPTG